MFWELVKLFKKHSYILSLFLSKGNLFLFICLAPLCCGPGRGNPLGSYRVYKGFPWLCGLEERWEDSAAPSEAPMLFMEGTALGFIVLCKLLGRSTTSPPQGWWEARRLPLRIVAGEAVKLM